MAKKVFIGKESTKSDFSYKALIDLHDLADMFLQQKNIRGAGTCYQIIGTKLTMQSEDC